MAGPDAFRERARASLARYVTLRRALEPQGRWDEFAAAFTALVERFDTGGAESARIRSGELLVAVER
jgi:hypothetical protein